MGELHHLDIEKSPHARGESPVIAADAAIYSALKPVSVHKGDQPVGIPVVDNKTLQQTVAIKDTPLDGGVADVDRKYIACQIHHFFLLSDSSCFPASLRMAEAIIQEAMIWIRAPARVNITVLFITASEKVKPAKRLAL